MTDAPMPADPVVALLPCPFCGGERARTIHIRDGRKVACICGACGKPEFHGPLDRPDAETRAITAWNTRTPAPAGDVRLKSWRGGEGAPADWDGGAVVLRDGGILTEEKNGCPFYWTHTPDMNGFKESGDIIAYLAASTTPDSGAVSGSAEGLREAERICRETADRATHQLDREDRRWQPTRAHYEGLRNALRNAERQVAAALTEGQQS